MPNSAAARRLAEHLKHLHGADALEPGTTRMSNVATAGAQAEKRPEERIDTLSVGFRGPDGRPSASTAHEPVRTVGGLDGIAIEVLGSSEQQADAKHQQWGPRCRTGATLLDIPIETAVELFDGPTIAGGAAGWVNADQAAEAVLRAGQGTPPKELWTHVDVDALYEAYDREDQTTYNGDERNARAAADDRATRRFGDNTEWHAIEEKRQLNECARRERGTIEPGANVAASARLGEGVTVSDGATVAAGAKLRDGVTIERDAVIDEGTEIGAFSKIGTGANVGRGTALRGDVGAFAEIGDGCEIACGWTEAAITIGATARIGESVLIEDRIDGVIPDATVIKPLSYLTEASHQRLQAEQADGRAPWSEVSGQRPRVHPDAVIAAGARIHPTAQVGAQCDIADDVVIGANARIDNGARIGEGSRIGAGAEVESFADIGENVDVGARAHVRGNTRVPDGTRREPGSGRAETEQDRDGGPVVIGGTARGPQNAPHAAGTAAETRRHAHEHAVAR